MRDTRRSFRPRRPIAPLRRGLACGLGLAVLCPSLALAGELRDQDVIVTDERLPERPSMGKIVTDTLDTPQGYCQIYGAGYADTAVSPAILFGSFPNFLAFALKFQGKWGSCSLERDSTSLL